jgi:hypothetical protein
MDSRGFAAIYAGLIGLVAAGCHKPVPVETHRHQGPKVNIADFISNTSAYKGKTITLVLKVHPAGTGKQEASVGRNVSFSAAGSKGERLRIVIAFPASLPMPESGAAAAYRVTFTCTRGSLTQGNDAREVEKE